jgi:hypothetical protein
MTTTTWRDLASELTADQIASLEHADAMMPAGRVEAQESLLGFARDYIELNRAADACAGIPVPPGAVADSWAVKTSGGVCRTLEWHDNYSSVPGVDVVIDGTQESNGDYARSVTVYSDDSVRLSAPEARELAAALVAAAEEFDRLNGDAPPFM